MTAMPPGGLIPGIDSPPAPRVQQVCAMHVEFTLHGTDFTEMRTLAEQKIMSLFGCSWGEYTTSIMFTKSKKTDGKEWKAEVHASRIYRMTDYEVK